VSNLTGRMPTKSSYSGLSSGSISTTGLATEAKQDTIITKLTSIDGELASIDTKMPVLGQALAAASVPVVLTAAQLTTLTPLTTVAVTQSGTWDEVGINDSGNSITVDNGGTFAVQVSSIAAGNNNIGDVDVASLPALAAGTNNIGDVDVLTLPAIPTGTNTIGSVKLTDGTDVADILDLTNSNPIATAIVDANGDQITSFGGGTQYTEDAAAAANPIGTALNLIRQDTLSGLTTTDGDNVAARGTDKGEVYVKHVDAIPVTDNGGALTVDGTVAVTNAGLTELAGAINGSAQMDVNIAASNATITVASHAVTNAGTFATQVDGAALTSLQLIDDVIATLGTTTYTETTTKGAIISAVRRDADTTLVDTTNEIGPLQMDANGRLKVEAFSGEALPVTLTSTTVTGSVAVTQSGTWDEVGINDSGNSITVDNGGTFAVQAAEADGANVTLGAKADAKSTATDTTAVSAMSVLKQISASVQAPPSQAVTNAGTFAVQAAEADGANVTLGAKADAKSTATDTTAVSVMSVLKQISASVQAPPSQAVTNAGTFATQVDGAALTSLQLIDDIVYVDDTATHATGTSKGALLMAAATPTDASVDANDIGAVAMTTDRKLHVSVRDALPAGTNAIGKLAANSGVDIGDVDVTTVGTITPGTAATSLGKAEDAAHTTGDVGVLMLGVRNDALAAFSDTNLDYTPQAVDNLGRVVYTIAPAATMTRDTASLSTVGETSVLPANASLKTYIVSMQVSNIGADATLVTLINGSAGTGMHGPVIVPAGGGNNIVFAVPLVTSTTNKIVYVKQTVATQIYISVQGYYAP
jgi:hypothetical protein